MLAVALPVTTMPTASAQERRSVGISSIRITPAGPVLRAGHATRVTVRVTTTGAQVINILPQGPGGPVRKFPARQIAPQLWEYTFDIDPNQPYGLWNVRVSGWDGGTGIGQRDSHMRVRRATSLGWFNARPEPLKFNHKLLLWGRLRRLDPYATGSNSMVPFAGQVVRVYFSRQKNYPRIWKFMGTARTRKDGQYWRRYRVREAGAWKVTFPGSAGHAPSASRSDYVPIRWT